MLRCWIVLAAALAFACVVSGKRVAVPDGDVDFDYYYFVRQWPATFCNDHTCTRKPPTSFRFTVHGLWPQRDNGPWPQFCDPDDPLRMRNLWDLLPWLSHYWPSWSGDNAEFWGHEWTRHGTCAQLGTQHHFFNTVLKLHKSLKLEEALDNADIEPSRSAVYSVADIQYAVLRRYGVNPHVTCDYHGNLAEIWMCISKELQPMNCTDGPHPHSNNYCNWVRIPPTTGERGQQGQGTSAVDEVAKGDRGAAAAENLKWDLTEEPWESELDAAGGHAASTAATTTTAASTAAATAASTATAANGGGDVGGAEVNNLRDGSQSMVGGKVEQQQEQEQEVKEAGSKPETAAATITPADTTAAPAATAAAVPNAVVKQGFKPSHWVAPEPTNEPTNAAPATRGPSSSSSHQPLSLGVVLVAVVLLAVVVAVAGLVRAGGMSREEQGSGVGWDKATRDAMNGDGAAASVEEPLIQHL